MRWSSGFLRNDNWTTPLWKRGRFKPVLPPPPVLPLALFRSEPEEDRPDEPAEKQAKPHKGMLKAA